MMNKLNTMVYNTIGFVHVKKTEEREAEIYVIEYEGNQD